MPASRKDDGVMFQSHVIANRRVRPSDWRAAVEKDSRRVRRKAHDFAVSLRRKNKRGRQKPPSFFSLRSLRLCANIFRARARRINNDNDRA
jgi:hypothetical protein